MIFKKPFLEQEFKSYYNKTGNIATHVFVHSVKQENISKSFDFKKTQTTIEGVVYSEMRSRDSDLKFDWDDTNFVAVGTYNDVKISKWEN